MLLRFASGTPNMALTTDALLFSIVLMLVAIQTALPVTAGGSNFLLAGVGLAVLALLGSLITSIRDTDSGAAREERSER